MSIGTVMSFYMAEVLPMLQWHRYEPNVVFDELPHEIFGAKF